MAQKIKKARTYNGVGSEENPFEAVPAKPATFPPWIYTVVVFVMLTRHASGARTKSPSTSTAFDEARARFVGLAVTDTWGEWPGEFAGEIRDTEAERLSEILTRARPRVGGELRVWP